MIAASNSGLRHRRDIDGLRGIAVLSVIGYHTFPVSLPGGYTGVDVFFVISGFLISGIILNSLERDSFSFIEFYIRRIRRIFPALVLVLLAVYAFGLFALFPHEFMQLSDHVVYGAGFASNFLLQRESGYFDNAAITKPLLHLWSLGVEEQFYLIWPLLLWLSWKWRLNIGAFIAAVGAVSLTLNVIVTANDQAAAFYSPQTRFWELMTGSFVGYLHWKKNVVAGSHLTGRAALQAVQSFVGALLIFIAITLDVTPQELWGGWTIVPVSGAALVISAGPLTWFNRVFLSSRYLVLIGLISYPLYLWHWPLLSFAQIIEGSRPSAAIRMACVAAAVILAWITCRTIENPLRYGGRGRVAALGLLAALAAIGAGVFGAKQAGLDGMPFSRKDDSLRKKIDAQFVWNHTSNDICVDRYQIANAAEAKFSYCMANSTKSPTMLVLGNSFANQLYPGLIYNDRFKRLGILNIGDCGATFAGGCGSDHGDRQRRHIDSIIEREHSVRFAVVAGMYSAMTRPDLERLAGRVQLLQRYGMKVVIVMPHLQVTDISERVDFEIKSCFALRPLKSATDCAFDKAIREQFTARFHPVMQYIRSVAPQVLFFEPNDLFCDEHRCRLTNDGLPLFRDRAHLSEHGSILLGKLFERWAETNLPELLETGAAQTHGLR